MKKEKGFTLIELLAVIVILAILMVIAIPKILNVIENSKKSAAESSIKLVKDAIKTQVTSGDIIGTSFTKDNDDCYTFNFDDQENGNAKELKLKNKEKITGTIKYCNGKFTDDELIFDETNTKKIICKRASKLHTDGAHTFGSLGSKRTLNSGDAFDCDVNGDGEYNSETERFYYVSDYYNTNTKLFEDDTAVLVYYSNTIKGKADNSNKSLIAYDASGKNNNGPVTAITNLPTTSQWSNVSLKNTSRSILTNKGTNTTVGGTLPSNFSYSGYSARLLTTQEISCNISEQLDSTKIGELDKCSYLMENTKYTSSSSENNDYWIENPRSSSSDTAWNVRGGSRIGYVNTVSDASVVGVRPVIEVLKKYIEY